MKDVGIGFEMEGDFKEHGFGSWFNWWQAEVVWRISM